MFADGVTICDDPHRPHGLRSRPFDGEGLPVSPVAIVEDGVLQTWLLDSAAARQLGLEPTGHAARGIGGAPGAGPSNLYMEAGKVTADDLIGDIARGVYVTELIGQGVHGVTGDYIRGAAGFLFEDRRSHPQASHLNGPAYLPQHVVAPLRATEPHILIRPNRPHHPHHDTNPPTPNGSQRPRTNTRHHGNTATAATRDSQTTYGYNGQLACNRRRILPRHGL